MNGVPADLPTQPFVGQEKILVTREPNEIERWRKFSY
jgi:hypothetical protein